MVDQPEEVRAALESEVLLEELAAIEHERWSHWQRYLHDQCADGPDGSLIIPADQARRIARTLDEATADCNQQPDTAG